MADCELIRTWRLSKHVSDFFPSFYPISDRSQQEWLTKTLDDDSKIYFVICDISSQEPIGLIFLEHIDRLNQHAEFGFYIGEKKYFGTGIGIEAELILLEYAFFQQNMQKIYCETLDFNQKVISQHIKIGFKKDGLKRAHIYKSGNWHSLQVMSILKGEFLDHSGPVRDILKRFREK